MQLHPHEVDEGQAAKLIQLARHYGRSLGLVEIEHDDDPNSDGHIPHKLYAYPWCKEEVFFSVYPDLWSDTTIDDTGEHLGGKLQYVDANIAMRFTFGDLIKAMEDNLDAEEADETLRNIQYMIAMLRGLQAKVEQSI